MARGPSYFKIGLFVLGAVALGVAGVLAVGRTPWRGQIEVVTYFAESVQGLDVGSPIRFRGVQVGRVSAIQLVRSTAPAGEPGYFPYGKFVQVKSRIHAGAFEGLTQDQAEGVMRAMVERGLRIRLTSRGLTGIPYLEADYLDAEKFPPPEIPWRPTALYVPSAPSVMSRFMQSADRVFAQLEEVDLREIATEFDRFLESATAAVDGAQVAEVSHAARRVLEGIERTNADLQALIGEPQPGELAAALGALRRAAEEAEQAMAPAMQDLRAGAQALRVAAEDAQALLAGEDAQLALSDLRESGAILREIFGDVRQVLARIQLGLRRAEGLLQSGQADAPAFFENLRAISENLLYLTESARQDPARIFFGGPPPRVERSQR
jgi:ABC-type transporter Mla subunit MlaD